MRTRLDVDDYRLLDDDHKRAVDLYLADELGLPLRVRYVIAVEATAEGTVRVERHASHGDTWGYVYRTGPPCPDCGRAGWEYLRVYQTLRPVIPPPWLAWPEEADPCE